MKPNHILAQLALNGITQQSVAEKLGCTRQAVNKLIHTGFGSDKLRTALAEAMGEDKKRLWPEYYFKKTS